MHSSVKHVSFFSACKHTCLARTKSARYLLDGCVGLALLRDVIGKVQSLVAEALEIVFAIF